MKKGFFIKTLDCFFATRPLLLVPVWGYGIFGLFRAAGGNAFRHWPYFSSGKQAHSLLWMVVFSCSVSMVYVINQLADIEADKKNGGLPLMADGIVSIKAATITAVIAGVLSIAAPLAFCKYSIALLLAFSMVLGALYSCRPTRLSGRPYFDFLANALGFGIIAFGVGYVCGGKSLLTPRFFADALPYTLLMCAGSISSTLPDMAGDRLDGKVTTAVKLGKKNAHTLAMLFIIAAGVSAGLGRDMVALICCGTALPIYIAYAIKPRQKLEEATYKVGGAIMMLLCAVILPILVPAALLLFFATSSYFRLRHKVKYPSLIPE
jgi:4-hydroxybenzoate polyprenyltransferase